MLRCIERSTHHARNSLYILFLSCYAKYLVKHFGSSAWHNARCSSSNRQCKVPTCYVVRQWWCECALLIHYYYVPTLSIVLYSAKLVCSNSSKENYFMMTHLSPDCDCAARIPYIIDSICRKVRNAKFQPFRLSRNLILHWHNRIVTKISSVLTRTQCAHTQFHNSHNIFYFVLFY